jgi:hypothetical protein
MSQESKIARPIFNGCGRCGFLLVGGLAVGLAAAAVAQAFISREERARISPLCDSHDGHGVAGLGGRVGALLVMLKGAGAVAQD